MVQQPQLTPLLAQLDAEALCEEVEKREGLLAIALPAMEAALRRAPDVLVNADSADVSVVGVRPRPGLPFRSPGGHAGPLPMQQRGGWRSGDVLMQWHQARRAYLCRPQSRSLIGAAASAQAVEHAARMLQAAGASESAVPAAKALLTTLAKLFAAPRAPCAFHTELQVRGRGRRRPQRPGAARCEALYCDSPPSACP